MKFIHAVCALVLSAGLVAMPAYAQSAPAATHNHDANALPHVLVHKSPTCGCCNAWIEHMRKAGFTVEARNRSDMGALKERIGVPPAKASCHTAEVAGYFVEGHVPAADVKRLLAERPDARGLTAAGMPAGSPGMEMPDGRVPPYAVELVANDGGTSVFSRHGD